LKALVDHPLTKAEEEISNILSSYGFVFADAPDIESNHFNFTALNIPDHHPAGAMHDTFYIIMLAEENGRKLLRSHTYSVEIYVMRENE
jgi:phenylalanyl-tRNA synthetase alpha chain